MKLSLNLSTRTYINRRALRTGLIASLAALLLWLLVGTFLLVRESTHLVDVKDKIVVLNAQQAELRGQDGEMIGKERLKQRWEEVAFINQLLERDSFRWTDLLAKIEQQAFSGVVVRTIEPDFKNNTLSLSGYARELNHMRKFIDNLIMSGDFAEVYLMRQSQESVKGHGGQKRKAIAFELSLVQGN